MLAVIREALNEIELAENGTVTIEATAADEDETLTRSVVQIIAAKKAAWTAEQLAKILECSVQQVYKMAKAGNLPSYRLGTLIRFDPKLTAAWLQSISMVS
jgi:excisionase family DNA binding protein